jgi:hypothetical protein
MPDMLLTLTQPAATAPLYLITGIKPGSLVLALSLIKAVG